jgi:hypothetical protein
MANSSKITANRYNCSEALIVPVYENDLLTGEEGQMMYMSGQMKYYSSGAWINVKQKRLDGSSSEKAASSATSLKNTLQGNAINGSYWYKFGDGSTRELWTDFSTYTPYVFVMVTRIWNGSQNQYLTTEENVTDLAITPADTAPTRHSKLSDIMMNDIISAGTIRWVIAGNGSTFYRLDNDPEWYSNHGANQSCSYARNFYDAYATPSSTPVWLSPFGNYNSACGGGQDASGQWLSLSGIHVNDNTYFGGYSGASSYRATPPSPYAVGGGSNGQWSRNGYVLLSW